MATCDFLGKGIHYAKLAVDFDNKQDYIEAKKAYELSVEYFIHAEKYENNPSVKSTIEEKGKCYLDRAEAIDCMLKSEMTPKKEAKQKTTPDDMDCELGNTLISEKPNIHWDDVAGLEKAKIALKQAVIMPTMFPHMFTGKREPWKGILLYGPPGTGKSYLAKALATEANAAFFSISSSDIMSKWQGESAKHVKQLFQMAKENNPSIIFIDEIDSLASARGDNDNESSKRVKTELLIQMNGVDKDTTGILVLGATNMPWSLDPAVRRRFEKRIYISLPCKEARLRLFKLHLGDTPHSLTESDFHELVEKTEEYSGSDIASVVKTALYKPIDMVQCATAYKKITAPDRNDSSKMRQYWTPCEPNDPDAIEATWENINGNDVIEPIITKDHFLQSLIDTPKSVSVADCVKHETWTREFGQEG